MKLGGISKRGDHPRRLPMSMTELHRVKVVLAVGERSLSLDEAAESLTLTSDRRCAVSAARRRRLSLWAPACPTPRLFVWRLVTQLPSYPPRFMQPSTVSP